MCYLIVTELKKKHMPLGKMFWLISQRNVFQSEPLMHHKAYFEKCLTSSLIVQENPKKFREFLAVQDLRSFPTLMNSIDHLATPESQHFEFDTRLEPILRMSLD